MRTDTDSWQGKTKEVLSAVPNAAPSASAGFNTLVELALVGLVLLFYLKHPATQPCCSGEVSLAQGTFEHTKVQHHKHSHGVFQLITSSTALRYPVATPLHEAVLQGHWKPEEQPAANSSSSLQLIPQDLFTILLCQTSRTALSIRHNSVIVLTSCKWQHPRCCFHRSYHFKQQLGAGG